MGERVIHGCFIFLFFGPYQVEKLPLLFTGRTDSH